MRRHLHPLSDQIINGDLHFGGTGESEGDDGLWTERVGIVLAKFELIWSRCPIFCDGRGLILASESQHRFVAIGDIDVVVLIQADFRCPARSKEGAL